MSALLRVGFLLWRRRALLLAILSGVAAGRVSLHQVDQQVDGNTLSVQHLKQYIDTAGATSRRERYDNRRLIDQLTLSVDTLRQAIRDQTVMAEETAKGVCLLLPPQARSMANLCNREARLRYWRQSSTPADRVPTSTQSQ